MLSFPKFLIGSLLSMSFPSVLIRNLLSMSFPSVSIGNPDIAMAVKK